MGSYDRDSPIHLDMPQTWLTTLGSSHQLPPSTETSTAGVTITAQGKMITASMADQRAEEMITQTTTIQAIVTRNTTKMAWAMLAMRML